MSVSIDRAAELAQLIRKARSVVALTGAGISVPSGIPDFRTPGTGLWANVDPMEVAHIDAFHRDPARFWSFYGERFQTLEDLDLVCRVVLVGGRRRRGALAGSGWLVDEVFAIGMVHVVRFSIP